jgi:excisionase family DNA binding protein
MTRGAELQSNVMTLREVADYLHCHYGTAYRLAQQGEIPGFRLGGNWRFLKSEVDKWIVKGGGTPSPPRQTSGSAPAKTAGRGRYGRKPRARS